MKVGDRIVIEPKKALQSGRSGVIEEVLQESPARVSVRWDDGRTSILSPAAGVALITPGKAAAKPRAKAKAGAAKAGAAKAPAAKANATAPKANATTPKATATASKAKAKAKK
jgi:hypothetical protein